MVTGVKPIGGGAMKSRKLARKVTASYHTIKNELNALAKSKADEMTKIKVAELEGRLEEIGGIDAYQQASIISTEHFKTSRWVLSQISSHLPATTSKKQTKEKLKVLEVGAINIQLQQVAHLDVRSIDINSQDARIEEIDFFDIPPCHYFDAVVCSMVVNCVHDVKKRGEMVVRLRHHLRTDESLLLLVLPLRCIHSTHVGAQRLEALFAALGFRLIESRESPRLAFYTLQRGEYSLIDKGKGNGKGKGKWEPWREESAQALKKNLSSELIAHFSQSFERVPPAHFSLSLDASLLGDRV